jgi:hypothetical protein
MNPNVSIRKRRGAFVIAIFFGAFFAGRFFPW